MTLYSEMSEADIRGKIADLQREAEGVKDKSELLKDQLNAHEETLWEERRGLFGKIRREKTEPDLDHTKEQMRLNSLLLGTATKRQELYAEIGSLKDELARRGLPDPS